MKSVLLQEIVDEVDEKLKSPIFQEIIRKYKEVNRDGSIQDKTVALFRKLTDPEKQFIRGDKGLQENGAGVEFAVKSKYYSSLVVYDSD